MGVAIFPMAQPAGAACPTLTAHRLHGFCAITFFACIAYVCWYRSEDTLRLVADESRRRLYRRWYRGLALAMLLAPLVAAGLSLSLERGNDLKYGHAIFLVEMAGVWVFAFYWLLKTREIRETDADQKVVWVARN